MLTLWNKVRVVPEEAKKKITGGRLNGKTDINPMFRIKTLTEQFGICGIGWYYEITRQWLEQGNKIAGTDDCETAAFVNINLYIKQGEDWSKPVPGTGGSSFITKESKGNYTSDEAYKMALTDAISVACKALGIGADVYWEQDKISTKYSKDEKAEKDANLSLAIQEARECKTIQELETVWKNWISFRTEVTFKDAVVKRKGELS
jgi:hypothetical protein